MSVIAEGTPYAQTYRAKRGKAGGLTTGQAEVEAINNGQDAGSQVIYRLVVHLPNGDVHLVYLDLGYGSVHLPHLYSLDTTVPVKNDEDSSGIFNSGHSSWVAFWDPHSVYTESRTVSGEFSSMVFQVERFTTDYESHPDNLRATDVRNYMKVYEERMPSKLELLNMLIENTASEEISAALERVRAHTEPHYMLHTFLLRAGTAPPDEELKNFFPSTRMYYWKKIMQSNFRMVLELSNGDVFTADQSNAIDPLWDRQTYPALQYHAEYRKASDDEVMAHVQFWNESQPDVKKSLYLTRDPARVNAAIDTVEPPSWNSALPYITIDVDTNAISEAAATARLAALTPYGQEGAEYKGIDDTRGINLQMGHGILGKPHWQKGSYTMHGGFGDQRNAGYPQCVWHVKGPKKNKIAALNIQSNKHNTNLKSVHATIKGLMKVSFGVIVQYYTNYKAGCRGGMRALWNLEELEGHILGRPPTQIRVRRAGGNQGGEAEQQGQQQPAPIQPIQPQPPHNFVFSRTDTHCIVLEEGQEVVQVPYRGQFHLLRDYLDAILLAIGPARFREYVHDFAVMNQGLLA